MNALCVRLSTTGNTNLSSIRPRSMLIELAIRQRMRHRRLPKKFKSFRKNLIKVNINRIFKD